VNNLSISLLAGLYQSGRATPEQIVSQIYDQIEKEPPHPVWISLVPRAEALAQAREVQGAHPGPLYGIPFAVKDNIDVAGLPTTAGCPAYSYVPEQTAFAVRKLLQAGAILIGKTNMDQFATGLVGTRSPYGACSSVFHPEYISGGSSSGSAVAVAKGLVSFALGTDTAGSGRVPAAFNNIVGLKPSKGAVSASGVVPACRSLDCVSIFALTAADAAAIFEVAKGFDEQDVYSRPLAAAPPLGSRPVRLGVPPASQLEFFGDREAEKILAGTVATLRANGAEIHEIDITPFRQAAELLYGGPYVAERYAAVGEFAKTHPDAVNPTVAAILTGSERYSAAEAYRAEYRLKALMRETAKYWQQIDAWVLPTAPTAYTIDQVNKDPIRLNANLGYYTNFVNLLDLSAVAVPSGFYANGLAWGITLIAPAFCEQNLLALADGIQRSRTAFSGARVLSLSDAPAYEAPKNPTGWTRLAVVGAHLTGQPLNSQLTERKATLLRTTRTAADYRFFALTNTKPLKPGLVRVPGFRGPGIEVEVWAVPDAAFGSFVAAVPPPLAIGSCELADGEVVKGFICEPYATEGMPEITKFESWRNYLASLKK
jgi:allophanate hydrolase